MPPWRAAAGGLAATMKNIDGATAGDQARPLKAYKEFLAGRVEFVESRIRAPEEGDQQKK